jgi:hypothetical protein
VACPPESDATFQSSALDSLSWSQDKATWRHGPTFGGSIEPAAEPGTGGRPDGP